MSKHTPGQWYRTGYQGSNIAVQGADGAPASIALVNTYRDEGDANARLIAAVPDLLAACEKALTFHDRYCDRVGPTDGWARAVHDALRSAIAKATSHE
jgi:hypothetical protein